jgi:phosphonate degradation associated HDIG domain protein
VAFSLDDVAALFARHGDLAYEGEGVSQLEHALQAAALAEAEDAGDPLVAAALLHDLGHILARQGPTATQRGVDDRHQYFVIPFLHAILPPDVTEPIRLHVAAKRALCALEPAYEASLSPDSRRSLALQGGPFDTADTEAFLVRPFAREAMRLRRWDDAAKVPARSTPALEHFLAVAARCVREPTPWMA